MGGWTDREVFIETCVTDPEMIDDRDQLDEILDDLIEEGVFEESDDGEQVRANLGSSLKFLAKNKRPSWWGDRGE